MSPFRRVLVAPERVASRVHEVECYDALKARDKMMREVDTKEESHEEKEEALDDGNAAERKSLVGVRERQRKTRFSVGVAGLQRSGK